MVAQKLRIVATAAPVPSDFIVDRKQFLTAKVNVVSHDLFRDLILMLDLVAEVILRLILRLVIHLHDGILAQVILLDFLVI